MLRKLWMSGMPGVCCAEAEGDGGSAGGGGGADAVTDVTGAGAGDGEAGAGAGAGEPGSEAGDGGGSESGGSTEGLLGLAGEGKPGDGKASEVEEAGEGAAYPAGMEEAALGAWRKKAGLPEDVTGYEVGLPEGIEADSEAGRIFAVSREAGYKYGIPAPALKALCADQAKAMQEEGERWAQEQRDMLTEGLRKVEMEWGREYEKRLEGVKGAARALCQEAGVPLSVFADASTACNPVVIRLLDAVVRRSAESPFVSGAGTGVAGVNAEEAKRIAGDKEHSLNAAFLDANHPDHKRALHAFAVASGSAY